MAKLPKTTTKRYVDYNEHGWKVKVTETYDQTGKMLSRITVEE